MFDLMTIEGTGEGERRRSWTVILFCAVPIALLRLCPPTVVHGGRAGDPHADQLRSAGRRREDPSGRRRLRESVRPGSERHGVSIRRGPDPASLPRTPTGGDGAVPELARPVGQRVPGPRSELDRAGGGPARTLARGPRTSPGADGASLPRRDPDSRRAGDGSGPPARPPFRRRAGCLTGAVLGSFGSFIAFSAFMASRMGPAAPRLRPPALQLMPLFYFGGILGGLLIGTLAGRWLGGFVADLRYSPTHGGAPAPKIHKGWVAAGAFLGWVIGAAVGMGLTMVVDRQVQARWLMPILFFSPPILLLVLGGFAGLNFARRRAAQRTGERPGLKSGGECGGAS